MNPYNGYTGRERGAKLRAQHLREREGLATRPSGPCAICGDPGAPVENHSEDYSKPYMWAPPAEYALCGLCHRSRLHKRFTNPELWDTHKAHVRRGGYSSDLRSREIVAELNVFRAARRRGEAVELRQLRPRPTQSDDWWEKLSMDPITQTSPEARPRP